MISTKQLINMAKKWQKMAAKSRRRITFPRSTSFVVNKGHFVVYTTDDKRFVMPLSYLKHSILKELFKMSEEEFGLSSDGPIRLPCDSIFMGYVITLVRGGVAKDLAKALIKSIETSPCSSLATFCNDVLNYSHQVFVSVH